MLKVSGVDVHEQCNTLNVLMRIFHVYVDGEKGINSIM